MRRYADFVLQVSSRGIIISMCTASQLLCTLHRLRLLARSGLLLLPLLQALLHALSLSLRLGLIPKLLLLLFRPLTILRPSLCPHPLLALCLFLCLFPLLLGLSLRSSILVLLAWSREARFRYANTFYGDGCIFVFVDVLVFLIDGLWFLEACEFFFVVVVIVGGCLARNDVVQIAICLLDESVYFFDVLL